MTNETTKQSPRTKNQQRNEDLKEARRQLDEANKKISLLQTELLASGERYKEYAANRTELIFLQHENASLRQTLLTTQFDLRAAHLDYSVQRLESAQYRIETQNLLRQIMTSGEVRARHSNSYRVWRSLLLQTTYEANVQDFYDDAVKQYPEFADEFKPYREELDALKRTKVSLTTAWQERKPSRNSNKDVKNTTKNWTVIAHDDGTETKVHWPKHPRRAES